MKSPSLLSICPSRSRPKALADMLKSYLSTYTLDKAKMRVYLNEDDPALPEYQSLISQYKIIPHVEFEVGKRLYLAEAVNYVWESTKAYDYYQIVNDDHFYITEGWDKQLIKVIEEQGKGWGIATPYDGLTDWNLWKHPSAEIVSGNIPKTLGYYIWPEIQHIGIDTCLGQLGIGINRLFRLQEVVIEHRHWLNGKRPLDSNYKFVYGQEQQSYGHSKAFEYVNWILASDINKIRIAMKSEGIDA